MEEYNNEFECEEEKDFINKYIVQIMLEKVTKRYNDTLLIVPQDNVEKWQKDIELAYTEGMMKAYRFLLEDMIQEAEDCIKETVKDYTISI